MAKQGAVKIHQSLRRIRMMRRLHFPEYIGMAADGPLAEEDQATRQNIGTFNGDANRQLLIGPAQKV